MVLPGSISAGRAGTVTPPDFGVRRGPYLRIYARSGLQQLFPPPSLPRRDGPAVVTTAPLVAITAGMVTPAHTRL